MVAVAPHIHLWWGQGFDRTTYHFFQKRLTRRGIQVALVGLDDSTPSLAAAECPTLPIEGHERVHAYCRAVVLPCEAAILLRHVAEEALAEQLQQWCANEHTLVVAPPSVLALLPQKERGRALPSLARLDEFFYRLSDELLDKGPAFPPHCVAPVAQVPLTPRPPRGADPQPTGSFGAPLPFADPASGPLTHRKVVGWQL